MTDKSHRLVQLDALRAISIVGVILIHIIGGSFHFWEPGSPVWTVFISLDQFFRFSVPLFVFISGYTLYLKYKDNFTFHEFFLRRVVRVLPWYFVWSIIIYIYINLTVKPGFVNYPTWKLIFLGKVDYHLYFVSMIFQLYLLFPLLLWLYKKLQANLVMILFALQAILYIVFSLDGEKVIQLPWRFYEQQQYLFFGTWIFYFVFGFILAGKTTAGLVIRKPIFLVATLALLLYAIYDSHQLISTTLDTNVATRSTRIPILLYSTSFLISALLYSDLFLKLKKVVINALLYFANLSFLVYLIHALVIRILGNFILPDSILHLLAFTVLVFSLSILLAQISVWSASLIPINKIRAVLRV